MLNPVQKELFPFVKESSEEDDHLLLLRIMHRIESFDFVKAFV